MKEIGDKKSFKNKNSIYVSQMGSLEQQGQETDGYLSWLPKQSPLPFQQCHGPSVKPFKLIGSLGQGEEGGRRCQILSGVLVMAGWRGAFRPVNWVCLLQRHKHFDMKCSNNPAVQVAAGVAGSWRPARPVPSTQAALGWAGGFGPAGH